MRTGAPVHGGGGQYLRGHAGFRDGSGDRSRVGVRRESPYLWRVGSGGLSAGRQLSAARFPAVRRIEMSSVDVADDAAGDSSINCKSAWDTRALSVLLGVLLSAP